MIRSNQFEKRYALLSPYITDETLRKNMLNNKDLQRKYDANNSIIMAYLNELDKRFDKETINKFIIDTIFKFPDEVLVSFITAYLNSSEEAKSNINVVQFYNKILHYGPDVIKHVEETGIVTNREFKELPKMLIDDKFNKLASDLNPVYRDVPVKEVYDTLTTIEKQTLIDFLEARDFEYLDILFSSYVDLKSLLMLMKATGLNNNIINKQNINGYGVEGIRIISATAFCNADDINTKSMIKVISKMLSSNRYELLNSLINTNNLIYVGSLDEEEVSTITEEDMYDKINTSRVILDLEKNAA